MILFSLLKTFNLHVLQMTIQYMQPGIEELIKILEKEE